MDVLTTISLCSGYEGLGLGLKRAIPNVRTVCYVERETYAVANLVAKINKGKLNPAWVEQLQGVPVGWTQLPTEWID